MRTTWILTALLLLPAANAYNIADYPTMFFEGDSFSATIVKGSERSPAEITAQNLIVNDLPRAGRKQRNDLPQAYYRYRSERVPPTIVTDDRIRPGDEIIIGTPCGNARVRELLNIQVSQCKTHFTQPQGLITLIEDENKHLVITGSDGGMVLDAAKILTNPRYRMQLRTKQAPIRRVLYRTSYQINGREVLDIGQTIGAVTPAISSSYPYKYTTVLGQDGRALSVPYQPGTPFRSMYRRYQ